jgi:hypothetical protein
MSGPASRLSSYRPPLDAEDNVETFEITLRSVDPVDLGDLGADGFESLVVG